MSDEPKDWIDGYLDETLSADEFVRLAAWLRESPAHAFDFARRALLHDRLQAELRAAASSTSVWPTSPSEGTCPNQHRVDGRSGSRRRWLIVSTTVAVVVLAVLTFGRFAGENPATAASAELDRLIAANKPGADRVYVIAVEDFAGPSGRKRREAAGDERRPPKAPLEGAVLTVRDARRFVLQRQMSDGRPFITGANGATSWAIRPEGPVRVSSDPTHFQRDVPGHEHSMSLANLDEALEQLRSAYDVQIPPVVDPIASEAASAEPARTLIAIRRQGQRGPRRVEATYGARTRQIRELRFIEMPYGPDRLTIRLTLLDAAHLPDRFYEHDAHHEANRGVEQEP